MSHFLFATPQKDAPKSMLIFYFNNGLTPIASKLHPFGASIPIHRIYNAMDTSYAFVMHLKQNSYCQLKPTNPNTEH